MKMRSGFVSNSSSSSFIVMGIPQTQDVEALMRKILPQEEGEENWEYENRFSEKTGLRSLYTERPHSNVIGKVIADVGSDGDYLEFEEFSVKQLELMASEVRTALGGGDIEPKLMLGTRPS
jgi:hypothetical protein